MILALIPLSSPKDEPSEEAPMDLGLKDPEEGTLPFPAQSLR